MKYTLNQGAGPCLVFALTTSGWKHDVTMIVIFSILLAGNYIFYWQPRNNKL